MGAAVKPRNPNAPPKQQPTNPNTKPSNRSTNIKHMTTSAATNAPVATVSPIRPNVDLAPSVTASISAESARIAANTFDALPPVTPTFGVKQELRLGKDEINDMLDTKLINPETAIVLLILLEYGTGVLYGEKFFTNTGDVFEFLMEHGKEDTKYQQAIFKLVTKNGTFNLKNMKLDAQLTLKFPEQD